MINKKDIKNVILQLYNLEITDGKGVFLDFRKKIKKIFNVKHVVLTNNGTSALYLAYKAIGLKDGDEVITGTYTYHSTNSTLLNFTKNIKFCDYDENLTISIEQIKKLLSKKTKLLLIPHTWGLSANMQEILALKKKFENLFIIEDCSQAHFARYNNKLLGTFGDIGVFSMQAGKILIAGEGGFAITSNKVLYEKMLVFSDSGNTLDNLLSQDSEYRKYIDTGLGLLKFRPNPLGIALANSQIDSIEEKIKTRRYFAKLIIDKLSEIKFIEFPKIENLEMSYYALVGIYRQDKNNDININEFLNQLRRENIFEIFNPKNNKPNHTLALFEDILGKIELNNSEKIYKNIIQFKISDDMEDKNLIENYIIKLQEYAKNNLS